MANIKLPNNRCLDGISLVNLLLTQSPLRQRKLFWGYEPKLGTAMRDGHWKMLTKGDRVELYDLSTDPKESNNVVSSHPERAEAMKRAIASWKLETQPAQPSSR